MATFSDESIKNYFKLVLLFQLLEGKGEYEGKDHAFIVL